MTQLLILAVTVTNVTDVFRSAATAESGSDVTMTTSDAAADRTSSDVTGGDGATEESMEEES